jgi:hypothetical protein
MKTIIKYSLTLILFISFIVIFARSIMALLSEQKVISHDVEKSATQFPSFTICPIEYIANNAKKYRNISYVNSIIGEFNDSDSLALPIRASAYSIDGNIE